MRSTRASACGRDRAALPRDRRPPSSSSTSLLSAPALAALQRFCLEATIWFDCKEHGGYLGAYLHEGFDHPVLIALAHELQANGSAASSAGHRLTQMWAFSYGQSGGGTRKHADKAAINVNLWITPDERLPRPRGGRPHRPRCRGAARLGTSRTTISTRRGWSASSRRKGGRRCTFPTAATGR